MKSTKMNPRIVISSTIVRAYFTVIVYVSCAQTIKANSKYTVFRDLENAENLNCVCETQNIVSINYNLCG